MPDHHHAGHAGPHHVSFDSPEMADLAELEGEVLLDLLTRASSMLAGLCHAQKVEVRRVLDLGCGPGVGTCCLAERFVDAGVVAADGSAVMLERAAARAERSGLGGRVETRLVELPTDLGTLERADLVWASMVVHHVGDEVAALRGIGGRLEPGGLLALVEVAGPMRFLPGAADLGRPGIWERLDAAWAAWFAGMRAELPGATESADYPTMLARAGFDLLADEVLTITLDPPLDERARRLASEHLRRTRAQLEPHADPADLEALGGLLDEDAGDSVLLRDDLTLTGSRHLYVARAASGAPPS